MSNSTPTTTPPSLENYPYLPEPVRITDQVWDDDVPPLVTIRCKTYRHEKFIRDALEGFLMQETTFRVEIWVHDDASPDKTAEIVREYEAKHPQLFKTTYQIENQFKGLTEKYIEPHEIRGMFVASCEGDDYWCDSRKLQNQFEFMKAHPDCSMCFHPAYMRYEDDYQSNSRGEIRNKYPLGKSFPFEWIVMRGGDFFPTPSVIYKRFLLENRPAWYTLHDTGDFPLALFAALNGEIRYIDKAMCVYRRHRGSVTQAYKMYEANDYESFQLKKYKKRRKFFSELLADQDQERYSIQCAMQKNHYRFLEKLRIYKDFGMLTRHIEFVSDLRWHLRIRFAAKCFRTFGVKGVIRCFLG